MKILCLLVIASIPFVMHVSQAQAQAPETIAYQGYLTDAEGEPMEGTVDLSFGIFDRPSGGTALWSEDQSEIGVSGGVFSVQLGASESLYELMFDKTLYLGVTIGDGAELRPRVALNATPYSLSTRGLHLSLSEDGDISNVVLGSYSNTAEAEAGFAAIGGGLSNTVAAGGAAIAGGLRNLADGSHSAIGGGLDNVAGGIRATIGGGDKNTATGNYSTVPGGHRNEARGVFAMAAGHRARAAHSGTFVWNDFSGSTDSLVSTGDNQFLIRAAGGVGIGTDAPSSQLTVAGTVESTTGGFKFPDGTVQATAALENGVGSTSAWRLGGNSGTTPETDFIGTIDETPLELRVNNQRALRIEPSGDDDAAPNVVAGHSGNRVEILSADAGRPQGVTISGGGGNGSDDEANIAAGNHSTIGGGRANRSDGTAATVSGGQFNEALTSFDTVGGGRNNRAEGGGDFTSATVGGGVDNTAGGEATTVGGGADNTATGSFSTVPGGSNNTADGSASFAAGERARAAHNGTFVWASGSNAEFSSTANDQFLIRADGGVGIGTNAPEAALHVTHPQDGRDLILGGAGESALFGDDGVISSDPTLPSSDLVLASNDAVGIVLDADGSSDETAEFIVTDDGLDEAFRVDLSGHATTGRVTLESELGEDATLESAGVYRDNVVYAWAHVDADGSTVASFGCTVSKFNDSGRYSIFLDRPLTDGMAPVVTPFGAFPVMATVRPFDDNTEARVYLFTLDLVNGQFERTDNAFFIQIIGRP